MGAFVRFLRRLWTLVYREKLSSGLDEEMAFHREQREKELVTVAVPPDAADYAVKGQSDSTTKLTERSHGGIKFRFETVLQDVRYAVRQLGGNISFAATIILTLALSIGANSAIFSVIDGVLLKSLPYPEPERITRVFLTSPTYPKFPLNPFDLRDFRTRSKSFESLSAFTRGDVQLSGSGEPVRLAAFQITAGYFRVLGLQPERGREFDEKDEAHGNGRQVILSDRLWRAQFGATPDIVGRKITLNAQPFTVVGVMPPEAEHPGNEYHGLPYGDSVDAWWPFVFEGDPANRGSHYIEGIGRLRKGVKPEQAQAEMNSLMAQLAREHPDGDAGWQVLVIPLYREVVGATRRMLLVLLGAVVMVLLIACANAANLQLARAATRQREIAVRLALGAPRSRLIRQLLTESLLVAFLGGTLGLAMAAGGVRMLVSLLPAGFPRAHEIHVSAPVFAFTFLISVATGILFGLAPALQVSRTDPRQGLHEGGRTSTSSAYQSRFRDALVVAEVGLACVLLIGAGLMLGSLLNLLRLDPGFRQEHVLTASLSLPPAEYKTGQAIGHFYEQLVTNLSSVPGVRNVGAGSDLPWTGYDENLGGFTIEGKKPPPHQEFHARYHMVSPDYFRALGIPLKSGRFFTKGDTQSAPAVLIINQAMAERYWPHENAVGKRVTFSDTPKDKDWQTVVGIVGDVKDKPSSPGAEPAFWWSELQQPFPDMSLVVRADSDPQLLLGAVRDEVRRLDPALAVADAQLMDKIADASIATPRFTFFLVGLFAGLAIILAAIGTYGVISYSVSQRTPEFGLRLALGAEPRDVLRLVFYQAAKLALAGAAVGVMFALMLARVLGSLIYDVSPADPLTFTTVGFVVLAVSMLACYIPARRATRSDPMIALRAQ